MASTTALQLVNRFLDKHNRNRVVDFTNPTAEGRPAQVALEHLNSAIETALIAKGPWHFDMRQAAVMTVPHFTSSVWGIIENLAVPITNASASDAPTPDGTWKARLILTSDASYGGTEVGVGAYQVTAGTLVGQLDEVWPGTSSGGVGTGTLFACEYAWPANSNGDPQVRKLLSMRHQERELRLEEIGKHRFFDMRQPRFSRELGTDPEYVYLGHTMNVTENAQTATTTTTQSGFFIWPSPTAATRLDYDFLIRHAPLAAVADTLENVPEENLNNIVEIGYQRSRMTAFANEPQEGAVGLSAALEVLDALYKAQKPGPMRKASVRSLDRVRSGIGTRRVPDTIQSL